MNLTQIAIVSTIVGRNPLEEMGVAITVNTRADSTYGHHQMINTMISLIIFFAAKDGEALYSQQKQDQELTMAQISSVQFGHSVVSDSL